MGNISIDSKITLRSIITHNTFTNTNEDDIAANSEELTIGLCRPRSMESNY